MDNTYWIALKKRHSGKLQWVQLKAVNEKIATEKAHTYETPESVKANKRYTLYAGPLIK